jgi:hypothetical protein
VLNLWTCVRQTGPVTSEEAIEQFDGLLTAYERDECLQYITIHFPGHPSCKIEASLHLANTNFGYVLLDMLLKLGAYMLHLVVAVPAYLIPAR